MMATKLDQAEAHAAQGRRQVCCPKALAFDLCLQGRGGARPLIGGKFQRFQRKNLLSNECKHPVEFCLEFKIR
jgi:hypothetical protein